MSLLTRKRSILAKTESGYGSDASPAAANAILIKNLNVTPFDAELVSRDLYRPYLGNSAQIVVEKRVKLTFEVELAGSGARGVAPGWGPLLRSCAFAETINTTAVTITRASLVATVTKTAHGLVVGDKVKISGCTETEYNGVQTIVTVPTVDTFTFAVAGSPSTPATGAPVMGVSSVYAPVSAAMESISIYFNQDGILHKALGARGTVEFELNVKQIPVMKFEFTGLYVTPAADAIPSVDYSLFQIPKAANTTNTPAFSLFSYSGLMSTMNLNMANSVVHRQLIGDEQVMITDRKPAGTFVLEAPLLSSHNFFQDAENASTGAMSITHGIVNGHKVKIDCPTVSIGNPNYQDDQGIAMLSIPFVAIPTDSGNDEVTVTVF